MKNCCQSGENMSHSSLPSVPEEFKVLYMMHNIGAITPERALSPDELSEWTDIDILNLTDCLQRLGELGYVENTFVNGLTKYHVTKIGMMKVLTLYS
jgi:hypothetical protein